jgi:hypothetical protein
MMKFLSLVPPSALLLLAAQLLFAQSASPSNQPATPAVYQAAATPDNQLTYFSLNHLSPDAIEPADADLLKKRHRDLLAEADFYGYAMDTGTWTYEQSVCPFMPDYVMLRYSSKSAKGGESLFTILVPRNGGRILIVPVLHNGATRFRPAPIDARNFQIFSQAVPVELARQNSGASGKWLTLSVCYAEMTGARPQVPNQPALDLHMINAPSPTLHISASGQEHQVRFVDPLSKENYRLWDITYNSDGRIIQVNDDEHPFGSPVVLHPTVPAPKEMPTPAAPPQKQIPDPPHSE